MHLDLLPVLNQGVHLDFLINQANDQFVRRLVEIDASRVNSLVGEVLVFGRYEANGLVPELRLLLNLGFVEFVPLERGSVNTLRLIQPVINLPVKHLF